jgi:hypothetical protein
LRLVFDAEMKLVMLRCCIISGMRSIELHCKKLGREGLRTRCRKQHLGDSGVGTPVESRPKEVR